MVDCEDGDVVDPVADGLDLETLQAVQYAIRGFSETSPAKPPTELTAYRAGKHDAYSAVMAILSRWIEELEREGTEHDRK